MNTNLMLILETYGFVFFFFSFSTDAGNIFANLESFGGDYIDRRELLPKHHSTHKHGKTLPTSGTVSIKTGE